MRGREEETVLRLRVEAVNLDRVPRYAWFKAPGVAVQGIWGEPKGMIFDGHAGFSAFESGRVYAVCLLNGKPLPQKEVAVLLQPGAAAVFDLLIPHQPLPRARAAKLAKQDFDAHLSACRSFWKEKLAAGASIAVPEPAVDERIRAGLLHCDLVALGKEPSGPVLATIGLYAPIGSESSPIIQFFDSMGWHKLAERSLEFFLVRQRQERGLPEPVAPMQWIAKIERTTSFESCPMPLDVVLCAADKNPADQALVVNQVVFTLLTYSLLQARLQQRRRTCHLGFGQAQAPPL